MVKRGIPQLFFDQFQSVPPLKHADVTGKTVCILGGNAGIGFEAAKHFAKLDAGRVIMACRNLERSRPSLAELEKETGYMRAELWIVDLANFASVNAFAERSEMDGGRLDILVGNAAIVPPEQYTSTSDGWEFTLQINHVSMALATLLLAPILARTAHTYGSNSRLVIVCSEVHVFPQLHVEVTGDASILSALNKESNFIFKERYMVTKLLNVFYTRAFNQHLSDPSIVIVGLDPGACISSIRDNISRWTSRWFAAKFQELVAYTAEEGGRQIAAVATRGLQVEKEENLLRGALVKLEPVEVGDYVLSDAGMLAQERVWASCAFWSFGTKFMFLRRKPLMFSSQP